MTHERKIKKSFQKSITDDVTLLRAKLAGARHQRPDVKYIIMFNKKIVLTISKDKKHILNNLLDIHKWDMEFVCFVSNEFGHFR